MSLPGFKISKTQNHRSNVYRTRKRNEREMGINLLACRDSNFSLLGSKNANAIHIDKATTEVL